MAKLADLSGLPTYQRRCIKAFRRIATRYEKTDKCFAAIVNLVASVLWTR
jgi:transposase